jgi:hypothetical protein
MEGSFVLRRNNLQIPSTKHQIMTEISMTKIRSKIKK